VEEKCSGGCEDGGDWCEEVDVVGVDGDGASWSWGMFELSSEDVFWHSAR
jgi:hypothetical protein